MKTGPFYFFGLKDLHICDSLLLGLLLLHRKGNQRVTVAYSVPVLTAAFQLIYFLSFFAVEEDQLRSLFSPLLNHTVERVMNFHGRAQLASILGWVFSVTVYFHQLLEL